MPRVSCPRGYIWGPQNAEHPSTRSVGWERAMTDPLAISACLWAGASCKELGESSDLGEGRLMDTVYLTNCREGNSITV